MTLSFPARRALRALIGDDPLIYVDCGARAGKLPNAFRAIDGSTYVGFEADAAECERMNAQSPAAQRYVCAFLGRRREARTFHVTNSPACSSLLPPNVSFLASFVELGDAFTVLKTVPVETIALGEALRAEGIAHADVLELDTQGTELEILEGAADLIDRGVLAVKAEVEFSPMYLGQALFADVDAFMRYHDFQLFDLSRYRVRREGLTTEVATRGQLLWGHALYLRNDRRLAPDLLGRLAAVAALLDLPDYAQQILRRLCDPVFGEETHVHAERVAADLARPAGAAPEPPLDASLNRAQWRD